MSNKPTVYFVDDDKAIRDSMKMVLKTANIPLASFGSAEEFLEAVPEGVAGVVLADLRLPGMNGLELMAELEEKQIAMPVILLTGHADVPLAVKAIRAGAFDVIEKPFNNKLLVEKLRQAMSLSQKWREIQAERWVIANRLARLTRREREVMGLLVSGMKNKKIAEELGISQKTLDIHRSKVMMKMEARTVADLVRWSYLDDPAQLPVTAPAREPVAAR